MHGELDLLGQLQRDYIAAHSCESAAWKAVSDAWAAGTRHDEELVKVAEQASQLRTDIFDEIMRIKGAA